MPAAARKPVHLHEDPLSRTNRAGDIFQPMKPGDRLWDDTVPGFYLEAGVRARSYKVVTRVKGRPGQIRHGIGIARASIGSPLGIGVEDARATAARIVADALAGMTPEDAKARREREAARAGFLTFKAVADRYLDDSLNKGGATLASRDELRRKLQVDLASWHDLAITDISHTMIDQLVRAKAVKARVAANRLLSFVKALFAWAKRRGYIEANPASDVETPGVEKPRERYLSEAEIALFWRACDKIGGPAGPFFKFLLTVAQRRGECAGMKRSELITVHYKVRDPATRVEKVIEAEAWLIPEGRTKRRVSHTVALSTLAKALLDAQPVLTDHKGQPFQHLFVSGRREDQPLNGWSRFKTQIDKAMGEIIAEDAQEDYDPKRHSIPPWHLHDLRATASTHMEETLDVPRPVISAVLNHSLRAQGDGAASTKKYLRSAWGWQAAEALQAWADYLLMVTGQNVVALDERRGA